MRQTGPPRMGVLRMGWQPSQGKQSTHTQRRTALDVDAPGNDGNAPMPGQVKRPNPWRKKMMMMISKYE